MAVVGPFIASGAVTPYRRAAVALVCAWTAVPCAADEPTASPLATLRRGGELSCQPMLPHFCENLHVRCVGQTPVATFAFTLRATLGEAPAPTVAMVAENDAAQRFRDAQVDWADDGSEVLLTVRDGKGYVRLHADGKVVLRHYVGDRGLMSLGQCR